MKSVSAYVIYNATNSTWIDDGTLITINCERLQAFTPRAVWIQRWLAPGDGTLIQYMPTFLINSTDITQYGANLVQGFWIEQDGMDVIIDAASINTITSACNACCDDTPAVTLARYYTGGIPLFAYPTAAIFCITRADDGSVSAHEEVAMAYTQQYVGNVKLRSSISGVSKYQVTSSTGWPPVGIGTDVVAAGACP